MKRSLLASASALALAAFVVGVLGLTAWGQEETPGFNVFPTFVYVPPITMLGAYFNVGDVGIPIVYGYDAIWLSFESATFGKYWSIGALVTGVSTPSPDIDAVLGLGYSINGALKAQFNVTTSGWYFLSVGFVLTLW